MVKILVTVKIDGLECEYPQGVDGYVWPTMTVTTEDGRPLGEYEPPGERRLELDDEVTFEVEVPEPGR